MDVHLNSSDSDRTSPAATAVRGTVSAGYRVLLVASVVAVFLLVTLGGVVRVTGSGLGCPDWPLCEGRLVPSLDFDTLMEYSHRLAASATSTLLVLTAGLAWWRYRRLRRVLVPVTMALALLGVELLLGGVTVLMELPATVVTVHLATAELIFALLLIAVILSWPPGEARTAVDRRVHRWAEAAAIVMFVVILSGSYTVGRGAGAACPGWPLCNGGPVPNNSAEWLHMAHRLLAGAGAIMGLWVAGKAWGQRGKSRAIGWAGAIAGAAVVAQTLAGAANPWTGFSTALRAVHLSLATAVWGSFVALATVAWGPSSSPGVGQRSLWMLAADYLSLTKPMIVVLLLITALGAMFMAAGGVPPLLVTLLVTVGGALAAGGANALNHYFDRDIDGRMQRTRSRPLPARRIPPRHALAMGVAMNCLAFAILALGVNLLAATLALGASAFYIGVYTQWLKRVTPQNIVIGGAAGAVPPMVGWAAITGGLDLPALNLFAIIFLWTPPHFWALALLLRSDYARANVPMLPVVVGVPRTTRSIMLHSVLLVAVSILLFTTGPMGWLYLGAAITLGGYFLFMAWRLLRTQAIRAARQLYLYSLLYLTLLFTLVMVDSLVSPRFW